MYTGESRKARLECGRTRIGGAVNCTRCSRRTEELPEWRVKRHIKHYYSPSIHWYNGVMYLEHRERSTNASLGEIVTSSKRDCEKEGVACTMLDVNGCKSKKALEWSGLVSVGLGQDKRKDAACMRAIALRLVRE